VEQAKAAYGIHLEQAALEDIRKDDSYDIIHLNHVFEHFINPVAELGHIHRLLKRGGMLYMEIPYQFHALEKAMFMMRRSRPTFGLQSLHHPYFYTPSTIQRLLAAGGFDVLSVSVFCPARYPARTLLEHGKKVAWRLLSGMRIGNHIEILAERPS
jgi:SAM-dependent methyltransferase